MMPKPPCYGCHDRTLTCHGFCQRYKDYKGELAEWNDLRWQVEQAGRNDSLSRRRYLRIEFRRKKSGRV